MSVSYSPPLRIDCRPAPLLQLAIALLAVLAALALWQSALPRVALGAVPVLTVLALSGVRRTPRGELLLRDDGTAAWLEAGEEPIELDRFALTRRGVLVGISFRLRGRNHRFALLPDTLPASTRRLIGLWRQRHAVADMSVPAHV